MHRKSCLSGGDQAICFWIYQSSCTFLHDVHLELSVLSLWPCVIKYQLLSQLTTLCIGTRKVPFNCHVYVYGIHLRSRIEDKAVFQLLITRVVNPRIGRRSQLVLSHFILVPGWGCSNWETEIYFGEYWKNHYTYVYLKSYFESLVFCYEP